jgi:hypothetical protein
MLWICKHKNRTKQCAFAKSDTLKTSGYFKPKCGVVWVSNAHTGHIRVIGILTKNVTSEWPSMGNWLPVCGTTKSIVSNKAYM